MYGITWDSHTVSAYTWSGATPPQPPSPQPLWTLSLPLPNPISPDILHNTAVQLQHTHGKVLPPPLYPSLPPPLNPPPLNPSRIPHYLTSSIRQPYSFSIHIVRCIGWQDSRNLQYFNTKFRHGSNIQSNSIWNVNKIWRYSVTVVLTTDHQQEVKTRLQHPVKQHLKRK